MNIQRLKTMFESIKSNAEGLANFLAKLEAGGYSDSFDFNISEDETGIILKLPEHEGTITVHYSDGYLLIAFRSDDISVLSKTIHNKENPLPELEEFIEQVKPLLPVSWKR